MMNFEEFLRIKKNINDVVNMQSFVIWAMFFFYYISYYYYKFLFNNIRM